jgi:hypothetical protein
VSHWINLFGDQIFSESIKRCTCRRVRSSNNRIIKDLQRCTERKGEITTKLIFLI